MEMYFFGRSSSSKDSQRQDCRYNSSHELHSFKDEKGYKEVTFLNILQFHSYVPLVRDHFRNTNGDYVIAMEFVEGGIFVPETEKQLHTFIFKLLEV